MDVDVSAPPRDRIRGAVSTYGEDIVVGWCTGLLTGAGPEAVPLDGALSLGGRHGRLLLADPAADHDWWWRVWGARGLLYAWDDSARAAVWSALDHDAWRVREGALRVVARRALDDNPQLLADRLEDPVGRVRRAAERALVRISSAGGGRDSGR